jgi:putative alpha-1,2-mannosidase
MIWRALRWNGRPYSKSRIGHAQLQRGGRLSFEMGPDPNPDFGAAPGDRPPS